MPSEPTWISASDANEINLSTVARTSEPHLLRDRGLLQSAIDRARNVYLYDAEADLADMAAVLLLGIARNHPFAQGNKRTGLQAAELFLRRNGYSLDPPDGEALPRLIIAAIEDHSKDLALADVLRDYIVASD